jgi:VanZ family protein
VFKKKTSINIAVIGAVISISIEISQLYHSPWIDVIRKTTIGGLVLGYGFLWSDIVCYIVGIAIGVILEIFLRINNFKV